VHHVNGSVNAKRDIEVINAELIIADLDSLERRMGENDKKARSGDKDAKARAEIYVRLKPHLESGALAIDFERTPEETELLKDLFLLTNKPFIYAVNVDESGVLKSESELRAMTGITADAPVLPISAKLEMEMLEFSEADRKEYLESLGITFNPTDAVIKTCYDLLGLQYYFTAGEIEVRAWTIKKGWTAPEAAGVIHTDFQKKFIKADVVKWNDLVESGGWSAAREKGKVRMEGKEYVVLDGDVMLFKFGG
jgi:GTP-binding protein YchF